jgi:hypothetical protein
VVVVLGLAGLVQPVVQEEVEPNAEKRRRQQRGLCSLLVSFFHEQTVLG